MKGIIFDMDNTLLSSKINFKFMRRDLIEHLVKHKVGSYEMYEGAQTAAEVLEKGRKLLQEEGHDPRLEGELFQIVLAYEREGMKGALLEEGAENLITRLQERGAVLAVVTNNSYEPACFALKERGIFQFFHMVVGREQMEALKPSPSGLLYVMSRYPKIKEWVMVGDSWIDGEAARRAGIGFVAYQGSARELQEKGLRPLAQVRDHFQLGRWLDHWLTSEKREGKTHG